MSDQADAMRGELEASFNYPQMSPRADALLPSDLLGDEESPEFSRSVMRPPRFSNVEGKNIQLESFPRGPSSPVSSGSGPGSLFASPHENPSRRQEADSPLGPAGDAPKSASRRLSGLFGFNRPRGKTLAEQPPLLGTLKPGQSQSFPQNFDELDPIGSRRRRLSYTGNWTSSISLLPRCNTTGVTADSSSDHMPSRRAAFSSIFSPSRFGFGSSGIIKPSDLSDLSTGYNQFSPRHDPIDPSSLLGTVRRGSISPRPSSTSFDNQLPLPSADNRHFGWPSVEKTRSPLGVNWASPSTWSRPQSRRPSTTQYGSSGHLPLGFAGDPDFLGDSFERQSRPLQAPIGTRPSSSHRPTTPKLNPAAPTFRIFGRRSDKDKEKGKDKEPNTPFDLPMYESSPTGSRDTKDSRPQSTATRDSCDSLERVASGMSVDNGPSKESFIQKLTRKGSSGKFGSWKDRSGLFSRKGDASQGDIEEDANGDAQFGKSLDSAISVSSTPSMDKSTKSSLSFFSRMSKRSEKAASETGDEDIPEETES